MNELSPTVMTTVPQESFNPIKIGQMMELAKLLSQSDIIPEHYHNKPANCFIAIQLADRCRADIFMTMQKTYVVKGKVGLEAQLQIAMANSAGVYDPPIRYEFSGRAGQDDWTCTAWVMCRGKRIEYPLTWRTVKKSGWDKKNLWLTDPRKMMRYRSASGLITTHWPEVLMGCPSADEVREMETVEADSFTEVQTEVKNDPVAKLENLMEPNGSAAARETVLPEDRSVPPSEPAAAADPPPKSSKKSSKPQEQPALIPDLMEQFAQDISKADSTRKIEIIRQAYIGQVEDEGDLADIHLLCQERTNELLEAEA